MTSLLIAIQQVPPSETIEQEPTRTTVLEISEVSLGKSISGKDRAKVEGSLCEISEFRDVLNFILRLYIFLHH